ncbi:hypothetical protein N7463_001529 [Penicillium fimorum]|uniref:Uncharacterized protein n=1 Tax=Penicillium fimorum TaxID=1882269 RepID=A0A9W9Y6I9_9EURO|nr:hypothetical protein N7463_001529 [Penicillium fimorum]
MSQQVNSAEPILERVFGTVVAKLHMALVCVDENGLAYTDGASKARANHKPTPHPDRSSTIYPEPRMNDPPAKNRIMKSIETSVDRENVELFER